MTKFVNLTPHPITIHAADGDFIVPPSGTVAKADTTEIPSGSVSSEWGLVPVVQRSFGAVVGLPAAPESDTVYLVSSLVLGAMARSHACARAVAAPDTGPTAKRDSKGQVSGVTRLVVLG